MSDFDDEPAEGAEAIDESPKADKAPAARSRREPVDDDWDDDWDDDDLHHGPRRDMTLIYAIIAAVVVIVLAVVLTRPNNDNGTTDNSSDKTTTTAAPALNWQGPVADAVGDVQKRIGKETGVFIWTDFTGWHVRSTLDEEVTVTVTADEIIEKGAKGDSKKELTATIAPGDTKKGVDLDFGFSSSSTFEVSVGGTPIPANQIKLGGAGGQADQNPVSFTKA